MGYTPGLMGRGVGGIPVHLPPPSGKKGGREEAGQGRVDPVSSGRRRRKKEESKGLGL